MIIPFAQTSRRNPSALTLMSDLEVTDLSFCAFAEQLFVEHQQENNKRVDSRFARLNANLWRPHEAFIVSLSFHTFSLCVLRSCCNFSLVFISSIGM